MQSSNQSGDSIHSVDLQALAKIRSEQGPVFSLYLDLRPDKGTAKDLPGRFDALLRQTEQQKKLDQDPAEYQQQWAAEAGRVRHWLEKVQPAHAQGLVVFTSQSAEIWQVFLLPVPVSDRLVVTERPYVRPLDILLGEFNCTLVILIDEGTARMVKVSLENAEEVDNLQAVPVTGEAYADGMRQYARSVAERAQAAWDELSCDHLEIGGSEEALSHLREALSDTLREHLTGEVRLAPQSDLDEIFAQVLEMEEELERRLEAQRVEQLIISAADGDGKTAVLGPEQTLLAVRAKKVRLLVAEEDFHQEGGECPNCGYLGEWELGFCPYCEMALRPEPDVIEAALKRILDEGGQIDVLRSPETRHSLEEHGHIGAMLLDSAAKPTEKNPSTQASIASDGEIHPDALYDEAVDESFPASDPPSW